MGEYKKIELSADDVIGEAQKTLLDLVREAHIKAMQEGIQANTVLLSEHFAKVNGFPFVSGNTFIDIPPMICGLEVRVTNELPEKYDFAVVEAPMTERERLIRETEERVKDEIATKLALLIKNIFVTCGDIFDFDSSYVIDRLAKELKNEL